MKTAAFFILFFISKPIMAQVNVYCDKSGENLIDCVTASPSLISKNTRMTLHPSGGERPTVELELSNNGDVVFLNSSPLAPTGLVSIFSDNKGLKSDYLLNLAGAPIGNNSRDAHDAMLVGDTFGRIEINISGHKGLNGKSTSKLCVDKIDQGFFGDPTSDDHLKEYRASRGLEACDNEALTEISKVAPVDFCPPGYDFKPELTNSAIQTFLVNRRQFKRKCSKTIVMACNPEVGPCPADGAENPNPTTAPSYTYVAKESACPSGYADMGITQEYPFSDEVGENVTCSNQSCASANLKKSFETRFAQTLVREPGESGSYGGKATLFIYEADSFVFKYENGSNGQIGLNDLIQEPTIKYCSRILDNKSQTLDLTSPERNTPAINLHIVTFYPFTIQDPSGLPSIVFPERAQVEGVSLHKKMDSSARDFLFRNLIKASE